MLRTRLAERNNTEVLCKCELKSLGQPPTRLPTYNNLRVYIPCTHLPNWDCLTRTYRCTAVQHLQLKALFASCASVGTAAAPAPCVVGGAGSNQSQQIRRKNVLMRIENSMLQVAFGKNGVDGQFF
eukprot:6208898-Amphidinium_carterae.2